MNICATGSIIYKEWKKKMLKAFIPKFYKDAEKQISKITFTTYYSVYVRHQFMKQLGMYFENSRRKSMNKSHKYKLNEFLTLLLRFIH